VPSSVAAADPDFGWNGAGQLQLQSEQVAGIAVRDPHHAVVTLLATVNGQLMELGVPVAASGDGVVISDEPAWLPAPQQVSPPTTPGRGSDPVAQTELGNELPAFFQAYASGDSGALDRFAVRGVSLSGLGGAVMFDSIASLQVPPGGATRQITVTVIWQVPGPGESGVTKLAMAYRMSVVDLQSGKWYVNEINAATEAVGAK
jgi:Conjugative transposon protein TcpC